jgi:DNA replication ATP-dependent helicase Dna2
MLLGHPQEDAPTRIPAHVWNSTMVGASSCGCSARSHHLEAHPYALLYLTNTLISRTLALRILGAINPMITPDTSDQNITQQTCFLCALDPHPCAEMRIEGRIIAAQERRIDGESVPFLTLDTGTSLAVLELTRYYRSLVKDLIARGNIRQHKLTMRVYHLPPPTSIIEHKGRPMRHYKINSYTLAVLEPDTLLNITDLNHAEYCSRQYLLYHLTSSPPSAAAIRGTLVHNCFKELLKEHDRGELRTVQVGDDQQAPETPLASLHRHFEQALEQSSIELALANVSSEAIRADVLPHLESLATWFQKQRTTLWDMPATYSDGQMEERSENLVRAETFLLAPEIGLRGRLDLLWQQSGRQRLLELKTGGSSGDLPRDNHRWQVYGYHALLTVRRESKMKKALATLLYSGTPGEAQAFGIPFSIRELQRVNETRNTLVLSHVTGIPPAPPGPSRCTKCAMLDSCERISSLLDWKPPQPDGRNELRPQIERPSQPNRRNEARAYIVPDIDTAEDREFFAKYYRLLLLEGREGEQQRALLWKTPVAERIERGTAIGNLQPPGKPKLTEQGEWQQTFQCVNTSELREGDAVLLSDGDPITGEVVTGTIVSISAEQMTVWTPELISHPTLIDRYDIDTVHIRTLQNLLRWLEADPHLRELVAGKRRPRFKAGAFTHRADFNQEQNLAVERAMQMQDYLLIHGPPGTGKTSVIAEIVKQLCKQGQRILLAAFTNQAVDNMLKRLDAEGFHDYVRLGHDRSVDALIQKKLLKTLLKQKQNGNSAPTTDTTIDDTIEPGGQSHYALGVQEVLQGIPVVASTTATWSSEKYIPSSGGTEDGSVGSLLHFDIAIIDEAGQLTIPAILGALRFAKRFILVGDEKQLPPLVLSQKAAAAGLADSLFSYLKQLDYDYRKEHPGAISASVHLRVQYRMNRWISHFASRVFYEGQLIPDQSVADRVLEVAKAGAQGVRKPVEAPSITRAIYPKYPLVFLDIPGEQEQGPKISDAEARVVREVVAGLLARGIPEAAIGIIAPYRAQVANLRRHLFSDDAASGWQALKFDTPMSVDTVDRFQGGERGIIIISFATTKPPEAESPLHDFLTNQHRLNVALTRAQRKLILVGCAPALEGLPVFQRLLNYCRGMKTLIPHVPASINP